MSIKDHEIDGFYTKLFTENPYWSTPFPNLDESCRWSKICEFLSEIAQWEGRSKKIPLRILDVGCGRGVLTRLANIYGRCEGVDVVASCTELAKNYFPDLKFYLGTMADLLRSSDFKPYDVVISSEVIEHVIDKERFVAELAECIVPDGYVILTTPRGEKFQQWLRLGPEKQPIEAWISEKDLRLLFENHSFVPIRHDRVYRNLGGMSLLHRLLTSHKFSHALSKVGLTWIHKGMQYLAGIYQVWIFRLTK